MQSLIQFRFILWEKVHFLQKHPPFHFLPTGLSWRTTSLRVGGRAARRYCLPGLRRGGGGRQAGATVLSGVAVRISF